MVMWCGGDNKYGDKDDVNQINIYSWTSDWDGAQICAWGEVHFKRDVDERLSISESLQIIIHDYRLVLQIIKLD